VEENVFAELRRYVRFDDGDESCLRAFGPTAAPHFVAITEEFYQRLDEHPGARGVFSGPDQVNRLKKTLIEWMRLLFEGPWDHAYYEKRARIGRIHVAINLPQRYMFGAMNLIRLSLIRVAQESLGDDEVRAPTVRAIGKIIDLELAIMLETYREAFVEKTQKVERIERVSLEKVLAMTQARYDEIVESGEALVVTFDPGGAIFLFNRRCEELTQTRREDAAARSWYDLFVVPEAQKEVRRLCLEVLGGRRGATWEGDAGPGINRRIRWQLTTLPAETGPVVCALGLDMTEEHRLVQRTRRDEHLAALGTMAAGLAHEIKNPLNAAHLQLTLMQRRLGRAEALDLPKVLDSAELVASELKRLAALVEQFLQFAKPRPLRRERVDLRATADVIIAVLHPEAEHLGILLFMEPGDPVLAEVDEEQVKQVLINLIRNALEATGKGGRVLVRAKVSGSRALLEVEDNGPGLSSPDAPIFEPFFTTKAHGTGLGLPIVHRIATQHGGEIDVVSTPGRTVFRMQVPVDAID
jgi:PAS domain S-box-containing protein